MLQRCFFPLLKLLLQLKVQSERFGVDLVQVGEEIFAQIFVIVVE
jgi:hypothetical protein